MKKILLKTLLIGLVFTFFGCTEENNYYTTADGLGKVNIYIEGNISTAEAQAKLNTEIGTQTENIYVQNTTQLTAININAVGNMRDIVIKNNPLLTTININGNNSKGNLIEIEAYVINNVTTTLNGFIELNDFAYTVYHTNNNQFICNDLVTIYNSVNISTRGSLIFNHLKYIKDTYSLNQINFFEGGSNISGNYTQFIAPNLEEIGWLNLYIENSNINFFTGLKKINRLVSWGGFFETLSLPSLQECNYLRIDNNQDFIDINLPLLNYCSYFYISGGTKLSSAKVNQLLHQFLTVLPTTGKTIDLRQGVMSPPTGTGIDDKNTLIAQGNTVFTN